MEQKITRMLEFDIDTKAEEINEEKVISGRPIVYGSVTDIGPFYEVIDRGALDEADLRDVALLVNHNDKMIPCARSRRNNPNSSMQLIPGEEGMDFKARLDTVNNPDSRALYSAIERGDISGMSFVLGIKDELWENIGEPDMKPTRHITRVGRVWEISACTFPAYQDTAIIAQRSQDEAALESATEALERAKEKAEAENMARILEEKKLALKLKLQEIQA